MKTEVHTSEIFDEKQMLQTLKKAIEVSKRTLLGDGILLIVWGLALGISHLWHYYESVELTSWWIRNLFNLVQILLGIGAIGLTVFYVFFKNRKVRTHAAISTRFVWIGVVVAHNLNVMVTNNFFGEVNFEMLHPLQMVLIGFALFVMGGIYRYYLLSAVSVLMWAGAIIAAKYDLNIQFLIRGISDIACFVVPGILMYGSVKKS